MDADPSQHEPRFAAARLTLVGLGLFALVGAAIATGLGFLGSLWWFFDLFSHFRVQYAIALLLAAVALVAMRRRLLGGLAILGFSINAALIVPLYIGPAGVAAEGAPIKITTFNVLYQGDDFGPAADYLAQEDSDVVVVLEATPEALEAIGTRLVGYQVTAEPRSDAFGIAVFTKSSLAQAKLIRLGRATVQSVEVSMEHDGEAIEILAIHTLPPVSAAYSSERDDTMALASKWARDRAGRAVVVGDFNASPWSRPFKSLLETGQLVNSQRGFGVQSSWPAQLWPLSIPIDHLVHSPAFVATERVVGPFLGSDHRPLSVTLARGAN